MDAVYSFDRPSSKSFNVMTHDSVFHADEVVAVAILSSVLSRPIKLLRSRDVSKMAFADYVLDVGGEHVPSNGRFDHHQKAGAGIRESGVPYATAGLIWKHFGHQYVRKLSPQLIETDVISNAVFRLDRKIISAIDSIDTGHTRPVDGVFSLSQSISLFNADPSDRVLQDAQFIKAVNWVSVILEHAVCESTNAVVKESKVLALVKASAPPVLILNEHLPWQGVLSGLPDNPFKRVVFPDPMGNGWRAQIVEGSEPFPSSWCGHAGLDFSARSGINDGVFCHSAGFILGTGSFESAVKLARGEGDEF